MPNVEFLEIAEYAMRFDMIFSEMWQGMRPVYSLPDNSPCQTAYVQLDKNGHCLKFVIYKHFWDTMTMHDKMFVFCHEIQHILLKHGKRMLNLSANLNPEALNVALDLPINEGLVAHFGFERNKNLDRFCWVDKILPNEAKDKSFEHYFACIANEATVEEIAGAGEQIGDHGKLAEMPEDADKLISEIISKINPEIVYEYNEKSRKAGAEGGGNPIMITPVIVKKPKWEDVIAEWVLLHPTDTEDETWTHNARRMEGSGFRLPGEIENIKDRKNRAKVYLFLDTSGSCVSYASRFFAAAASIPDDKFDVQVFCFDTAVYPTTLESQELFGFGGTAFHVIETYLQENVAEYPKLVFIVTDSYGGEVYPEFPDRWMWFLTERTFDAGNIPPESDVYMLADFE